MRRRRRTLAQIGNTKQENVLHRGSNSMAGCYPLCRRSWQSGILEHRPRHDFRMVLKNWVKQRESGGQLRRKFVQPVVRMRPCSEVWWARYMRKRCPARATPHSGERLCGTVQHSWIKPCSVHQQRIEPVPISRPTPPPLRWCHAGQNLLWRICGSSSYLICIEST